MTPSPADPAPSRLLLSLFLLLAATAVFWLRFTGPCNLSDSYHQERAAAYIQDALLHHRWISQDGAYGDLTSKPPLFTWLGAWTSLPFGQATWLSIGLPGALATVGIVFLIFFGAMRPFGIRAAFFAALLYLFSPIGAKQMFLVRIDGLFAFTTVLTALLAFSAWQTGRGWTWFWLAGALATLTKGPLGIVLGACGLLAIFWERRTQGPVRCRGSQIPGVLLYLLLTLGWFWLAYEQEGQRLMDVMLGRELVGHAVTGRRGVLPFSQFYDPTLVFLSRFAPWSLLTLLGLWRIWKRPSPDEGQRRFERFLFCWFLGGLFLFSAAPHQRPDLIFPLIPVGALIAGRALALLLSRRPRLDVAAAAFIFSAGSLALYFQYHVVNAKHPDALRTALLHEMADELRILDPSGTHTYHVDTPFALQFFLNTKTPYRTYAEIPGILRTDHPVFITVADDAQLRSALVADPAPVFYLDHRKSAKNEIYYVISNRPAK